MHPFWARALAMAALAVCANTLHAADAVPTAQTGLEQVQAQKRVAYEAVLAQFDRAIAATPDDAAIGVARCEYIHQFTDDEIGDWVDGAEEDFAACGEWLQERWPAAPAVQLFELEQAWGDDAIAAAETLGKAVDQWPAPLRVRAFAHLAYAYEDSDSQRAGDYAVRAAELGHAESARQAIEYLASRKRYREATTLLDTLPVPADTWIANNILREALELPDRQAAWRTAQRFERGGRKDLSGAVTAAALLRTGDVAGARKRLGHREVVPQDRPHAFDIAVAARDADTALSLIDASDLEQVNANLGRFAILATAMPSTLFSAPMISMAFVLVAMLLGLTLFCGALLVPVHYRGLARRLRHLSPPALFERASLRRAWYGLAIALCVPMLAMFFVAPESVQGFLDSQHTSGLYRGMLWGSIAGLLFLAPMTRGMSRRELVGDRAVWRSWKRLLLAWGVLMLVAFVQAKVHEWTGGGGETLQTKMVETVVGEGNAALGGFGAMLLIALLGPVFEEIVFRGLLLGGLARHISFGWANALQALAFALAHDDAPRFAFYFAMGLLGGWLVKSTRSLGPAIALHVLNNALFVALRML